MFEKELINVIRSKFLRGEEHIFRRARSFLDNDAGILVAGKAAETEARTKAACLKEALNLKALEKMRHSCPQLLVRRIKANTKKMGES